LTPHLCSARTTKGYTATNKPDEVKKWQAERAKYLDTAPPAREKVSVRKVEEMKKYSLQIVK
jgi:hypothetical protein